MATTPQRRRYDKGERRHKHVGRGAAAEIVFVPGQPKMWIGRCPRTLTSDDNERLINEALSDEDDDRETTFPSRLYAVHDGVIYEGRTTDRGHSYHGFPYHGKLGKRMIARLKALAVQQGCGDKFDAWVKRHIEIQGR